MTKYEGGLGTRESGDLVHWSLDIDEGMEAIQVYGGRREFARTRQVQANLTLFDINKLESEAIIQLVNEMRSAVQGIVLEAGKVPSIGDRFAGLEL